MALILMLGIVPVVWATSDDNKAESIVKWLDLENTTDNELIKNAGISPYDWYAIALSQLDKSCDLSEYASALESYVKKKYSETSRLSATAATEWHRIILAVEACGGDPTNFGGVNLVADGIYDYGKVRELGKQGLTGWIWALIASQSVDYKFPDNSFYSADDIIQKIVGSQLEDGGFTLFGKTSSVDVTAMAIVALAPFCDDEKVNASVNKAVVLLSKLQNENGSFSSGGDENCESTSQVVIALCAAGINPDTDSRFVKQKSVYKALREYVGNDGSVCHVKGGKGDKLASAQALLAYVAFEKFEKGQGGVFTFKKETPVVEQPNTTSTVTTAVKPVETTPDTTVTEPPAKRDDDTNSEWSFNKKVKASVIIGCSSVAIVIAIFAVVKKRKALFAVSAAVIAVGAIITITCDFKTKDEHYSENSVDGEFKAIISIRCDDVYKMLDKLDSGLNDEKYLRGGEILTETEVSFKEGETVYDVLRRATSQNEIQMETSGSSYGVYVEGINYLYQFSCGEQSGWVYYVNGEYAQVSCSAYKLSDGDKIEWKYSVEP